MSSYDYTHWSGLDRLQNIEKDVDALKKGSVGGSQDLSGVLTVGNDAGGLAITNLADPSSAQDAATKAYVDANSGGTGSSLGLLPWSIPGTLSTQTGTAQLPIPVTATIADVTIRAATAPTGASIKVDVNKNGTTVFTTQANRPTIAISANASSAAIPDVTSLIAGDYLSVDVDQVGSTIPGSDLVIVLRFA